MNEHQELERLREAFKRRDRAKQNAIIATIIDTSPHANYGFIIAQLDDQTVVNVQAWNNLTLTPGGKCFVLPISNQPWNWYVMLGYNESTDLETTPFTPPTQPVTSMAAHDLDGALHTGSLPWGRIDTSSDKVDLSSDITGVLPAGNQASQTTIQDYVITTASLDSGITGTGNIVAPTLGYVRRVSLTGGSTATIEFTETNGGTTEYLTGSVSTPFTDQGGWVHYCPTGSTLYYAITNDGGSSAVFTVTLQIISWSS